ncbi:hypothetical protein CJD36_003715 [Flavipsychrobacter stenotrophus]|uniref:Uncharacterized protein n=1 Tax=Flavipsychrobacter stenotrophus TaxID=2077091 RepID=A0A2S7T0Y8_9BACT|nr:hypothetical protein [Flavipsychrobacter stenotrophus]PQJ12862.1 hypothetical protein CJD36_003715 [Flavipsychrobacter stenotrophus]
MAQIVGQTTGKEKVAGRTVKELAVTMRLVNSTGTGTVTTLPVLRNITVKSILHRVGTDHTILEGNLQNYAVDSHYERGLEAIVSATYLEQKGLGQALLHIRITLPDVINCHSGDMLETDVSVLSGTYTSYFNVAQCVTDIQWVDAFGVEHGIPYIAIKAVQGAVASHPEVIGDGVQTITLLNFDQGLATTAATTDANQVVTGIQLNTNIGTFNETADHLNSRSMRMFETQTARYIRGQCYRIHSHNGALMHDVRITLTMNAALNTAANNFIVVRGYKHDGETHIRAHETMHKHQTAHVQHVAKHIGNDAISKSLNAARNGARHLR